MLFRSEEVVADDLGPPHHGLSSLRLPTILAHRQRSGLRGAFAWLCGAWGFVCNTAIPDTPGRTAVSNASSGPSNVCSSSTPLRTPGRSIEPWPTHAAPTITSGPISISRAARPRKSGRESMSSRRPARADAGCAAGNVPSSIPSPAMARHREVDQRCPGREQTRRGRGTFISGHTLVFEEKPVISSRNISALRKPVMIPLQLGHLSKNPLNGRCLSIADTRTGHLIVQ